MEQEFIEPQIDLIIEDNEYYSKYAQWCNENGYYIEEIEPLENGTRQFQIKAPKEPTQEELVRRRIDEIKVAVQNVLDTKAHEQEYDDGFTLATYATSTKERYRNQANQFIAWRDNVWDKCYEILNAFKAGEIEMPTVEYVLERLPTLKWEE